jgi:hypothetical protein
MTQMRRFQNDLFSHAINVCVLSLVVGAAEGLGEGNPVLGGARFHDLGQTRLLRNLVRKRDPYLESERRLMEQHRQGVQRVSAAKTYRTGPSHVPSITSALMARAIREDSNQPGCAFQPDRGDHRCHDAMLMGRNHAAPNIGIAANLPRREKRRFDRALIEIHSRFGGYPVAVWLTYRRRGIVIAANRSDSLNRRYESSPGRTRKGIGRPGCEPAERSAGSRRCIVRVSTRGKSVSILCAARM